MEIETPYGSLEIELIDKNPKTAQAIQSALPITGSANRWGDEIYFEIPVSVERENTSAEVEVGDVAYWPPGHALCIFFGRTPASTNDKPKAASPVNVFGRVKGSIEILKKVKDGDKIIIK